MPGILVVLQCPYGHTEKRRRQLRKPRVWLAGLWRSYTGQRLREMLPEDAEVHVTNANPTIGRHAGAVYPPDLPHLQRAIRRVQPDVILACGQVAQRGLSKLDVPFIGAPHPAWRQLSKKMTAVIRAEVAAGLEEASAPATE